MASNTPKTMSNRLATMKFMQRSATKAMPSTPDGPPSKKVRLSNSTSAPGTPATPSNRGTPQSATTAEDKKREDALVRAAEKSGETRWVLSFKDPQHGRRAPAMQVRQAGFAVIDAEEDPDDEEEEPRPVRMQFGGGLKKKKKVNPATPIKSEDAESESDSSDADEDDPTAVLIRETKREVKAKERDARRDRTAEEDAPRRRIMVKDEDMDLGGLTTLSGGSRFSNVECHNCKQKGHMRTECPKSFTPRGFAGRGRGRGRR